MTGLVPVLWSVMAVGCWLVARHLPLPLPPARRLRVLPYVGDPRWRTPARAAASEATPWIPRELARRLAGRLAWVSGGDQAAQRRLSMLGLEHTIEQFRLQQLLWGFIGGGLALAVLLLRGANSAQLIPGLVLVTLGALAGVLARDRLLSAQVTRRAERLRAELPTIIEMLAMAVGAGAGLTAALERVSNVGNGVVASELSQVMSDVRVGMPLVPALQRMSVRNESNELRRFVDSVVVSLERGTPLADVLVAQATDAREASRRALIESGGRKEIGMMIPVVFLVLPLSVVFVLFPGFYGLQLGSS